MAGMLRLAGLGAMALLLGAGAAAAQSTGKTLRFVPQADLRSLDPIWTTAYITRNHGYMVYDTLLAMDSEFKPQPQMVDTWTESPDKKLYTFTLRDGVKWHDGAPVRSADCIASIDRRTRRDVLGQKLGEAIATMTAKDDKTFTIELKQPFPLLLEGLAKLSSNTPFMLPERLAKTDAFQQVTDATGSGPFKFVKDEWVPGSKVVYVKNTDYVPRKEKPNWAAGGKVVKVDRVEWIYIPDPATASAALNAGEVDWYEQVPADLVKLFKANKDVTVETADPLGSVGILRFNHTLPPFDNPKMRQALAALVDQKDYMTAVAGDPQMWLACYSVYACKTPMASEAGADILKGKRDLAKAKQLIKEAGYKGEKLVLLSATDQPIVHAEALVTAELLRQAGLNVELAANDWGTLITRRASKEPIDKGGWSMFFTWTVGADMLNPAVNSPLRGNGEKAWFGWPVSERIEKLRDAWFAAPDLAAQQKVAAEIQVFAFEDLPFVPAGQFVIPTAYRKNVAGIIAAPVAFLWNVEKK